MSADQLSQRLRSLCFCTLVPSKIMQGLIPGSKNVAYIKDNLDIMDFTLTDDEMAEFAKLNKGVRYYTRTDEALAGFAAWQPQYEKK